FYIAAQVVSGVVHRSLRGHYPRLFLAGAAIQLGAPLIAVWPSWQTLAPLHLLLLGLLAYGLLRFTHEWLHTIFVDGEKVAFFAAGLLLYAVGTSFVHLTWGVRPVPIPAGYYAPYLMAVCGLLFYLDASFKTHAHRHVFLSHFTFLVYGVSVVAVLLSLDAPVVRLITLGMAAALYTMVLIKYLTLIPFYLMIASLAGLYTDGILTHFSPSTHLLIATPGLYGLIRLSSWAIQRGFSKPVTGPGDLQRIGLITYRIALLFLAGLTVWTLTYSTRGFTAMATGLVVSGFLVWMLRTAPGRVTTLLRTPDETGGLVSLLDGPWLYAPIGALTVGLVFAPPIGGVLWSIQSAAVLMMLSVLWSTLFVLGRRPDNRRPAAQIEVLANSVLLGLFASTALVALATSVALETSSLEILILAAGAALLFTLSVNLYVDWLFYASLLWVAATAVAVKGTYFPQQGVGITEMLVVAAIWGVTWWLGRQPDEWSLTAKRRAQRHAPRHLLWLFPCASEVSEAPSVIDTSIGGDSMRSPSPRDVNAEGSPTEDRRDV
ncbi:MAG: hypothetical protein GY794_14455, partial [bacterium]|nr:hypothetical protein [bacterium]